MRKNEVEVGKVYRMKVGNQVTEVRLTAENPHGGWDGVNVATKRKVRIKSPQRLRGLAQGQPARSKAAEATPEAAATSEGTVPVKPKRSKAKERRPSGLAAAAQVLADAGEPLSTKQMVERMLERGLWSTGGKTPAATIYSAIIREIAEKGDQARFRKVERGRFELNHPDKK